MTKSADIDSTVSFILDMSSLVRVASIVASRSANRRFMFTIGTIAILSAKLVHIYSHIAAISTTTLRKWGPSFFAQDIALVLFLRVLLDKQLFSTTNLCIQILAPFSATLIVMTVLALASVSISFYAVAGSELHWHNVALASDSSSWATLLTGLVSFSIVLGGILIAAWVLQDICHTTATLALEILRWPLTFILNKLPSRSIEYCRIPSYHSESSDDYDLQKDEEHQREIDKAAPVSKMIAVSYVLVSIQIVWLVVVSILRPDDGALIFMSWTLPLLPLLDCLQSSSNLAMLKPFYDTGINHYWDDLTALGAPIPFPWLPNDRLDGFEDWYNEGATHYNASADPLRVSNLEEGILLSLGNRVSDLKIRHIMLIKMESTRKDVFPFKKDGLIWRKIMESYENSTIPENVIKMMSELTPTARFLTGDYGDGLIRDPESGKTRGGISANNVFTTSTYTLKSLAGTLCGISPLVADFNAEAGKHVYQPCLPHIFEAFNKIGHKTDKTTNTNDFTSYPWRSWWMQSVTGGFDRQDQLMPAWGFKDDHTITKEYLQGDHPKFGKATMEDVNYYGMPEVAIEEYIRDAFRLANNQNERVFLTHLTSTSHHPFGLPKDDEHPYVSLTEVDELQDLSKYLNAIHYTDRWLEKVLGILEEMNVADETLVVAVGDHGLSVAENRALTPYCNPNIGNFHVPLFLSHPKLPSVDIDDPVVSSQILPTILDLLLESESLTDPHKAAARDLLNNYEGQSLLRPQRSHSSSTGQANWQFTVMNPGRAELAVRDARQPNLRLIVPVSANTEWRFADLATDPHEQKAILSFVFNTFLERVAEKHGVETAKWIEEAAFISRWWVDENLKRWRFCEGEENNDICSRTE